MKICRQGSHYGHFLGFCADNTSALRHDLLINCGPRPAVTMVKMTVNSAKSIQTFINDSAIPA